MEKCAICKKGMKSGKSGDKISYSLCKKCFVMKAKTMSVIESLKDKGFLDPNKKYKV